MLRELCMVILLTTGFEYCAYTQQNRQSDSERDSGRIEPMVGYITLKWILSTDIERLGVATDQLDIRLRPNANTINKLSFNYRFISFTLKFIPKFLPGNDDDNIKGKTKGGGFGLNLNFRHWLQEIGYNKVKGYYLDNTSDYVTGWKEGDPYIQFPQLVFWQVQGITSYNFNPGFSVNAVTTQSERQLKSAGSFIAHFLYRYYKVENQEALAAGATMQKSGNIELLLGAGYYYTFAFKDGFYISAGLAPGAGYILTKLTTRTTTDQIVSTQSNFVFRAQGQAGLGYNGHRFFAGLYSNGSIASFRQQNTTAINDETLIHFKLFAGYRLKAPAWLRDQADKLQKLR